MLSLGALQLLMTTSVAAIVVCILMYSAMPNLDRIISYPADNHLQLSGKSSQGAKPASDKKNTPRSGVGSLLSASLKASYQAWSRNYGHKNRTFKIPYMGNYNCSDTLCMEFIPSKEFYKCNTDGSNNGSCHFMNGTNRAPVALASFPGSGNTWVRGLLEQATGICTGAIYCDKVLREGGFNGEGYRSGEVIVVKTHYLPWFTKKSMTSDSIISKLGPPWGSAIFIIRDPRDALVAEWNRRTSAKTARSSAAVKQNINSHVTNIGETYYGDSSEWEKFIKKRIDRWTALFEWVYYSKDLPVLVVKYESIETNMIGEVERMLNFLSVPFSREALKKRMSGGFETFHRPHTRELEQFTSVQREYIYQRVENLTALLKSKNNGDALGIEDYLEPSM